MTQQQSTQPAAQRRTEDAQLKFNLGDRVQILHRDHLDENGTVVHIDPVYSTHNDYIDSYLFIVKIDGWPSSAGDAIFSAEELEAY